MTAGGGGRRARLDLRAEPLEGTGLIEASAGTGKTRAIVGLFLRLVVERKLPVDRILVITYTVAATGELRDKIRRRLGEAARALEEGAAPAEGREGSDGLVAELVGRIPPGKRAGARELLLAGLRDFDEAAIFTIHGFCQRALGENAFESGSLFDTELVTDQLDLVRQVAEDFWRTRLYGAPPLAASWASGAGRGPAWYAGLLSGYGANPDLRVIPDMERPDVGEAQHRFEEPLAALKAAWPGERRTIEALLLDDGLNRSVYKPAFVPRYVEQVDGFLGAGIVALPLPEKWELFTPERMARATKKGRRAPAHALLDLFREVAERARRLAEALDRWLRWLDGDFLLWARRELPARKARRGVMYFDDLLVRLRDALAAPGGERLAAALRARYAAALVDEFQDTDTVQFAILDAVFGEGAGGERPPLFLIGDPKQAIYGFRGADVFAYMAAAARAGGRVATLDENWRSEPRLVRAVNALFSCSDAPFVLDGIEFSPARAAPEGTVAPLVVDGAREEPLRVWHYRDEAALDRKSKRHRVPDARRATMGAAVAEIARLVRLGREGRARIGEAPLAERDIAVLVPTNREAQLVARELGRRGIPAVLSTTEDLFATHEAEETLRLLAAVASPGDERLVRAALATDMLGEGGAELDALARDETAWGERLEAFGGWHDAWLRGGFAGMMRRLLHERGVAGRLVAFPDGERRLTNVRHLVEALHREAAERGLGMRALVKRLGARIADATGAGEWQGATEHQLRLETDEEAVRILTVHRCKGLQFPVVFCPFSWRDAGKGGGPYPLFHDAAQGGRATVDLGSDEEAAHAGLAGAEALSEKMRLLYVALTRARNRCYIAWGRVNNSQGSALAYLLHGPSRDEARGGDVVALTLARSLALDDDDVRERLDRLAGASGGTIRVVDVDPREEAASLPPRGRDPADLGCPAFTGRIDREWRISSFSSLVQRKPHLAELPHADEATFGGDPFNIASPPLRGGAPAGGGGGDDPLRSFDHDHVHDHVHVEAETPFDPAGFVSFPRGTDAGDFAHELLERLDFTSGDRAARDALVARTLARHGFGQEWAGAADAMLDNVLAVPLDEDDPDLTLSRVGARDRASEMGFFFPLGRTTVESLGGLLGAHGGPALPPGLPGMIERLRFDPARGFMTGFIDLVFRRGERYYLVDWKTNFLGGAREDYAPGRLAAAMRDNYYILQYTIYAVALDRHLRARLPGYDYETHFGGVFYLFLRGVDAARGPRSGVHRARPPRGLVDAFGRLLVDGAGEAGR